VVGTQARVAPEIEYLRHLIADGFVGEVLSTTLVARGGALQEEAAFPTRKPLPICWTVPMAPPC
jgi:predicted dehydrogenase